MASITCEINNNGVTYTVHRIDPHDEIVMVTNTPNTALQWKDGSPFGHGNQEKEFPVPSSGSAPQPIKVMRSMELSSTQVTCGELDPNGNFKGWKGAGFPPVGTEIEGV